MLPCFYKTERMLLKAMSMSHCTVTLIIPLCLFHHVRPTCMFSISALCNIGPYPVHVNHTIKQEPMSVPCIIYSVTSHPDIFYPADFRVEQYSTCQQTVRSSCNVRHLDIMNILVLQPICSRFHRIKDDPIPLLVMPYTHDRCFLSGLDRKSVV